MVRKREIGGIAPSSFQCIEQRRRVRSIELASHKEIVSAHKSGVNSLQVDATDARYLLAGASDGSIAVYDTQQETCYEQSIRTWKHEALFLVDKGMNQGHTYSVSCVHWYPIDTGIFVTGSFDHLVNVWDTNTIKVELQFNMSKRVYAIAMSAIATTHMLIATGTEDAKVKLCDLGSGAFTHTLTGHRDSVWAVQWSATNEWVLVTGGCDGAIRFWDVRRAGCYHMLDQHRSQIGRRPPILKHGSEAFEREFAARKRNNILQLSEPNMQKKSHSGSSLSQLPSSGKSTVMNQKSQSQRIGTSTTAHYGSVTGLQATSDGLYLLSAGTDLRVRMWDMESGCNTLINYPSTRIRGNKATQMALSPDSSLLFTPSANAIVVYDVWTGQSQSALHGHYDIVNCCAFHPHGQELYSGSSDRKILVWAPPPLIDVEEEVEIQDCSVRADEDTWSD